MPEAVLQPAPVSPSRRGCARTKPANASPLLSATPGSRQRLHPPLDGLETVARRRQLLPMPSPALVLRAHEAAVRCDRIQDSPLAGVQLGREALVQRGHQLLA